MSYIRKTGNLAATPELRHGDHGPYAYARVVASDRIRNKDCSYRNGPATTYSLLVSGQDAVNLVDVATACGNISVIFSGDYTIDSYTPAGGETRLEHKVIVDSIGVNLRLHQVRTLPKERTPAPQAEGIQEYAGPVEPPVDHSPWTPADVEA